MGVVVVPPLCVGGLKAEVHADGEGYIWWWCYPSLREFGLLNLSDQDALPCLGVGIAIGDDASLVKPGAWLWSWMTATLNVKIKGLWWCVFVFHLFI